MNSPKHPGTLVGEEFDNLSLSVVDAADILGVDKDFLVSVCSGSSDITEELAESLASFLDEDVRTSSDWKKLQSDYNSTK